MRFRVHLFRRRVVRHRRRARVRYFIVAIAPHIFGILNITEDSFSDGGRYLSASAAESKAIELHGAGADVIDIGAASSHPDARSVSSEVEIARLTPLIGVLKARGIAVSLDSFASATQTWGLAQDVSYLNDVRGFDAPSVYPALASSTARLIVMYQSPHARDLRADTDVIDEISRFFDMRLAALTDAGVAQSRLIIDPGMGRFLRPTPSASLRVLGHIDAFRTRFCLPLMLSVSRKQFLRDLVGRTLDTVAPITLATELYAIAQGADYIRTHEVAQLADSLTLIDAIKNTQNQKNSINYDHE